MSELIRAENLCIRLKKDESELVKDINFTIESGKSLMILGQSGSGKTMTCRAIMGLLYEKQFNISGKIIFDGKDLLSISKKEKQKLYGGVIAMIPQNPMTAFSPSRRIGIQMKETLQIHSQLRGQALKEKIHTALIKAELNDAERVYHSYPHALSGGMLQRVMIAMALMVDAKLIVADEPTTALDVVNRNSTIESFIKLREQGTAVLIVTHDFSVAAQIGGDLLIMKDGEIIERGDANKVLEKPVHTYTQLLLEASMLTRCNDKEEASACCKR